MKIKQKTKLLQTRHLNNGAVVIPEGKRWKVFLCNLNMLCYMCMDIQTAVVLLKKDDSTNRMSSTFRDLKDFKKKENCCFL